MTPPDLLSRNVLGLHENVPATKEVSSDLLSTNSLTVLARIEIVATSNTMNPSDPPLLTDVTLRCGMYPAGKVDIS